ncbi:hypothetical protein H8959_018240 [Pygathrix nigripes]
MPLTLRAPSIPSAALGEPQLCYILDAILFLYGIVLTLLYCRLKIQVRKAAIASFEVWTLPHLVSTTFQPFSPSGAPAWDSGPLGGHASQVLICIHLRGLPPTLPSQARSKIFDR